MNAFIHSFNIYIYIVLSGYIIYAVRQQLFFSCIPLLRTHGLPMCPQCPSYPEGVLVRGWGGEAVLLLMVGQAVDDDKRVRARGLPLVAYLAGP